MWKPYVLMREERWEKLKSFITEWHQPLTPGDGYSEAEISEAEARLGTRLPEALREWYGLAGKWYQAFQVQDQQLPLEELEWSEETLVFQIENQLACAWSLHAEDCQRENPPVYDEQNEVLFADRLTDFLAGAVVKEIFCGASIQASEAEVYEGEASPEALTLFTEHVDTLTAVSGREHCFASSDALAVLSAANQAPYPLLFLARTDAAREKYCSLLSATVQWSD